MATEADVYTGLTEIFHDVFMRDDLVLTPELNAKQVQGWDSFKQIEILISSEERFGVKLTSKEIDGLKCIGDLAGLILLKAA